jgi:hypothetical protein
MSKKVFENDSHTSVPDHKKSTKSFQKGSQNLHANADVIPANPESGTNKLLKGSARSAAGEGLPAHESRKVKLGAELKRAHAENSRRENNQADPEGGEQL